MRTSADFLDEIARRWPGKKGLPASDYAIAKLLGVTQQAVSHYRRGRSTFSDEMCVKVAELAALDPGYVLACSHAQRAKRPHEREAWARMAEKLSAGVAGLILFGILMGPLLPDASAAEGDPFIHYTKLLAALAAACEAARRRALREECEPPYRLAA